MTNKKILNLLEELKIENYNISNNEKKIFFLKLSNEQEKALTKKAQNEFDKYFDFVIEQDCDYDYRTGEFHCGQRLTYLELKDH